MRQPNVSICGQTIEMSPNILLSNSGIELRNVSRTEGVFLMTVTNVKFTSKTLPAQGMKEAVLAQGSKVALPAQGSKVALPVLDNKELLLA